MDSTDLTSKKQLKLVKSVSRTIDLLLLFVSSSRYLSFQDICQMMDIPKSSAFELIQTMLAKGIIELKSKNRKIYGLSLLAFEIGCAALSKRGGFADIARPYIQELNRNTGSTSFLGVEDHGSIVYIDKAEDHSVLKATSKLGERRHLHTTGLGKSILFAMPNEKILSILGPEPYATNTPLTHTSSIEILLDAERSRARGYAVDDREDSPNMFCIGSAIKNNSGEPIAAISVASVYSTMNDRKKELISKLVKEAAMSISRKLGFTGASIYSSK